MAINDKALLQYESGQNPQGKVAMTDSGDRKKFTTASAPWSKRSGYAYEVKPNGLDTGGAVSPASSGSNDVVDVAALTCYLSGVKTSVSASTDVSVTRGAASNTHSITSITVTSAGAIAAVAGTASTAFTETRGAAGGPPYIPVGSIEIAQVRTTSITAAAIQESEIFSVPGTHTERSDFPVWTEDAALGSITFSSALPAIHTGDVPKGVYIDYALPIYADVPISSDFQPSSESVSVNSTQYYGITRGSRSTSLNGASFTASLNDGITDPILKQVGEQLWFKFFQDKNREPYILENGTLGLSRTFGPTDHPSGSFTITPEAVGVNVES